MRYKEKARRLKDLFYQANSDLKNLKWRDPDELGRYLEEHGGRVKQDRKRRRGYLVSVLQDPDFDVGPPLVAEVPMGFAEKVLALGWFP